MEIIDPKGSQYAEIDADAKYHITIKEKSIGYFLRIII